MTLPALAGHPRIGAGRQRQPDNRGAFGAGFRFPQDAIVKSQDGGRVAPVRGIDRSLTAPGRMR
jgi:hypothetical protein